MNLSKTVEAILGRPVTLEEAKDFANDQFGMLSAHLRQRPKSYYPALSEARRDLREKWNEINKKTPTDWEEFVLDAEAKAHRAALAAIGQN